MNIIIFFFSIFGLILPSFGLFCSKSCSTIRIKHSSPFIEPSIVNSCVNDSSTNICKGRIIAYYYDKTSSNHIDYTFGRLGDTDEQKYENQIETHGLSNLIKYEVKINAKKSESKISADIYCTDDNECALNEIRTLFNKYRHQKNPFNQLKSYIYSDIQPKTLICYLTPNETSTPCQIIPHLNPVCMSYSKELKQECSFDTELGINLEFILASPYISLLDTTDDLVKCNIDNCNDHVGTLKSVKTIAREYAYGNGLTNNHARKEQARFISFFCMLIYLCYYKR